MGCTNSTGSYAEGSGGEAALLLLRVYGRDEELELTFNHDGSTYDLGTACGNIAVGVDDVARTLADFAERGIGD